MEDNKTPIKEVDLSKYLDQTLLSGDTPTREEELRSFANSALGAATKKWKFAKVQSDMSVAFDAAQKYTPAQIVEIIYSTNSESKAELSKYYFEINDIYKILLLYYTTLLTYDTLVVPNYDLIPSKSEKQRKKMYSAALSFLDMLNTKVFLNDVMFKVLRDGVYFGLLRFEEEGITMQPLLRSWCRVEGKDIYDNYNFSLDIAQFANIYDPVKRQAILDGFPKYVTKGYDKYIRSSRAPEFRWLKITSDLGLCLFTNESLTPMFVNVIEDILLFQETKTIENERALEELSKIVTHKIPLDKEGNPIFEIPEVKALHLGLVNMFEDNKYIDIITSFGEIKVENIQSTGAVQNQHLDNMAAAIYNSAGVSKEIFSADKNTGLKYSAQKDSSITYSIIAKAESWLRVQVNSAVGIGFNKKKIARFFEVSILFLSHYNREDYIKIFKDLAMSGYSKILPYVAAGVKQSSLENLITLEEDLNLVERLEPLKSSYTASADDDENNGAPEKKEEEKTTKTIQNKNAGGEDSE